MKPEMKVKMNPEIKPEIKPDMPMSGNSPSWETIALPDADLRLGRGFYRRPLTDDFLQRLLAEIPWRQETITLWGKQYRQPRLSAWYGDAGRHYAYSGLQLAPLPWNATLARIKAEIEHATGQRFNSVLVNRYRNELDSVGWHSDAERELGPLPVIASLSLGATRRFRLRPKHHKPCKSLGIDLDDGSLLLMAGNTQQCWQHAVPTMRAACGERLNLTFRLILSA